MPKAGSTTIQYFLRENAARIPHVQLSSFGGDNAWKLAIASNSPASRWYFVEHARYIDPHGYEKLKSSIWEHIAAEAKTRSRGTSVVASSEFIFMLATPGTGAVSLLCRKLKDVFGEIKVILYLRDQNEFLKSMYAQLVKGVTRLSLNYTEYVRQIETNPILKAYINLHYDRVVEEWANGVGVDCLDVVYFHRENFYNGLLVDDFCQRADIPFDSGVSSRLDSIKNYSGGFGNIAAIRLLNQWGVEWPKFRSFLLRERTLSVLASATPESYRDKIIQKVADGNMRINSKYLMSSKIKLPTS